MVKKNIILPPARSKVSLLKSLWMYIKGVKVDFSIEICKLTGNKVVVTSNSWVRLLSLLLIVLKNKFPEKDEIILTKHSCYEFTDAILQAGLIPVYLDVNNKMEFELSDLSSEISRRTLGIISICNLGLYNNLNEINDICKSKSILHIEDATYSIGGMNSKGVYGSFGDFAVYNFSEGKAIPIGGGGIGINNRDYIWCEKEVRNRIVNEEKLFNNFFSLLRYVFGSSNFGYTFYKSLVKISNFDLKRRYSMEPSRRQLIDLPKINIVNLGKLKKISGTIIVDNIQNEIQSRQRKYDYLKRKIIDINMEYILISNYSFSDMIIKVPILLIGIKKGLINELEKFGVIRLYGTRSRLYSEGSVEFKNSNIFYENLFTIPLHDGINKSELDLIIGILKDGFNVCQ